VPRPEAVPGRDAHPHREPDPAGARARVVGRGGGCGRGARERGREAGPVEGEDAGLLLDDRCGLLSGLGCVTSLTVLERHPDNVAAALYGGFVGTYLNDLSPEDTERKEIPLSEVLPELEAGVDTGLEPPKPPVGIGHYMKFPWAKEIKAIAIIPQFEVATAKARSVLPTSYSRADVVFNLQRIALLPSALGRSPPDAEQIYLAMQDKVHQPYRKGLIPGLPEILRSVTPKTHPGLCGICLSGAGPTILALATDNFEQIAKVILEMFAKKGIECVWKLLEPANDGTTVAYS
jgi:homoserine kinase